jgi:hypothetical protein
MSGVANEDPVPGAPSDPTVSGVSDAEAGREEAPAAGVAAGPAAIPESDTKPGRKGAPHLRVVTGEAPIDFVAELPAAEPAPVPEVLPNQRIGSAIRARRETLGYSLDQVSKDTRVHLSHLRAIEDMTPNLLGAPVYAKGYIRAYARYLGLDEMSTLERYLRECAILKDPEKHDIAPPQTGRKLPATVPVLGFLIVALLAAGGYFFINGAGGTKSVAAAPPASSPLATTTAAMDDPQTPPAIVDEQQLFIVALRRSEMEIRSADGTKIARRELEPGERRNVRMGAGWTVSATTDGSAFQWELGGKSLGLLSEAAAPTYAQSADLAAARPPVDVLPAAGPAATDTGTLAATGAAPPPAASTGAPSTGAAAPTTAPKPPRPPRQRPPQQTQTPAATTETATPPAAAAPPPAQPTAPASTPAQDPALAAYPNQ